MSLQVTAHNGDGFSPRSPKKLLRWVCLFQLNLQVTAPTAMGFRRALQRNFSASAVRDLLAADPSPPEKVQQNSTIQIIQVV